MGSRAGEGWDGWGQWKLSTAETRTDWRSDRPVVLDVPSLAWQLGRRKGVYLSPFFSLDLLRNFVKCFCILYSVLLLRRIGVLVLPQRITTLFCNPPVLCDFNHVWKPILCCDCDGTWVSDCFMYWTALFFIGTAVFSLSASSLPSVTCFILVFLLHHYPLKLSSFLHSLLPMPFVFFFLGDALDQGSQFLLGILQINRSYCH